MARFSGATVLLILVAAVSAYTCAILAGAAFGRTLETTSKLQQLPLGVSITITAFSRDYFAEGRRSSSAGAHAGDDVKSSSSSSNYTVSAEAAQRAAYIQGQREMIARRRQQQRGNSNFTGGEIAAMKVGPWGGSGGYPFYMRSSGAARLRSVTLYHSGDAIHAFSYEYVDQQGVGRQAVASGGGPSYGPSKGSVREKIYLSPDEHIIAVKGTSGRSRSAPRTQVVITSLTLFTDKGRTYGPYGELFGVPFSVPAVNGCIVGFWGRSGRLLDAIGVYIAPSCKVDPNLRIRIFDH